MEASSSSAPPATPTHPSLLHTLSPTEQTPAPLHPNYMQQHHPQSQPRQQPLQQQHRGMMGPPHMQQVQASQPLHMGSGPGHQNQNVFGAVMGGMNFGPGPGSGQGHEGVGMVGGANVYASVYSGIPVFEAMIRGISVMRRTSDSWVNATQILKVAGVPKSARTKILEKEILSGVHEKVQGGYGKYQGTWIPFQRGQDLAASYGVSGYLAPIFDFVPSPNNIAALLLVRQETPDRAAQKAPGHGQNPPQMTGFNPLMPGPAGNHGRMIPTYVPQQQQQQYVNGDRQILSLPPHPAYAQQGMYFPPPMQQMTPSRSSGIDTSSLSAPADINGMGLPPSGSEMYLDQYGQVHPSFTDYPGPSGELPLPPAKRQRSDEGAEYTNGTLEDVPEEEAQEDDDSSDDIKPTQPLPNSMRLSHKPLRPKSNATAGRTRQKLLLLFRSEDSVDLRTTLGFDLDAAMPTDFDVDMVIDDQGHTALHWACALAKMSLISQLIELGADIHRGNYAGETPLIRSVLTTNHAEAGTFSDLLQHLSPAIRTLDHAYRSIIHHISLIAGLKGRASSARSYMAAVLEWVAKEQQSNSSGGMQQLNGGTNMSLKNLVDVQDTHGDTALNVAARVGNKGLVKLLLDAGADKARCNKLGLKPQDFGIEVEALKVSPAEAVVSNLKSEAPKPERQSRDVQKNISAIFETINESFSTEMLNKQTKLNATEASVRHATRALSEKRQNVQRVQASVGELEQLRQKSENVRRALATLNTQDWTGRSSGEKTGAAFRRLPPHAVQPVLVDGMGEELPMPERGEEGAVVKLRRLASWEDRVAQLLEERTLALEGESTDKAVKYRRLVSLCTKVPVDKVDGMLDGLTNAIESDGQGIDMGRISGLMSRMKEQTA